MLLKSVQAGHKSCLFSVLPRIWYLDTDTKIKSLRHGQHNPNFLWVCCQIVGLLLSCYYGEREASWLSGEEDLDPAQPISDREPNVVEGISS